MEESASLLKIDQEILTKLSKDKVSLFFLACFRFEVTKTFAFPYYSPIP